MRLILILLLISTELFAQGEMNKWYFGVNSGLDFTNGDPVSLNDGQLQSDEGCSSIADQNGSLLMYTNGNDVWNSNHTIMPNGTGLLGHVSSSQSALIVPKPGSNNIYYIFTADVIEFGNGLNYSEVDMNLELGLGDVTVNKNVSLISEVCEKLTAVKHDNGQDVWVVSHEWGTDKFVSFLVTSGGVNSVPVLSQCGPVINGLGPNYLESIGCMKISPDGDCLAMANYGDSQVLMFDFNTSSGTVTNHRVINDGNYVPYGVEFSRCGKMLYAGEWTPVGGEIFQYGLDEENLVISEEIIATDLIQIGTLQLGPNGKIYIAETGGAGSSLSVINSPESLGVLCDFAHDAISVGNGLVRAGLPSFVQLRSNCDTTENPAPEISSSVDLIPNIFTPNNDGVNDTFILSFINGAWEIDVLTIRNRWGNVVYSSNINNSAWDGKINGSDCSEGTYFWSVQLKNNSDYTLIKHGFLQLVR